MVWFESKAVGEKNVMKKMLDLFNPAAENYHQNVNIEKTPCL
jgi:hypothetical protein